MKNTDTSLLSHFGTIKDPRIERRRLHKLIDIIAITIAAVISGAEGWEDIEDFGKCKKVWLRGFLELPNGVPSHDTFRRVISSIRASELQTCFVDWVQAVFKVTDGEVIAIDGKTARRSYERGEANGHGPIHMVSAWASKAGFSLGQQKIDAKSNEITAIPLLLRVLELKGCIVTIDAMGCQKNIVKQIIEQEGDYVVALKGNQSSLARGVEMSFEQAALRNYEGLEYDVCEDVDKGHGRIETRRCETLSNLFWFDDANSWVGLKTIVKITSTREIKEKTTTATHYYISSLPLSSRKIADSIRSHWGIENSLHWVLDVSLKEDDSRIRTGDAQENLAILRRLAINALKRETSNKRGIKAKTKKCGWDNDYLQQVLVN